MNKVQLFIFSYFVIVTTSWKVDLYYQSNDEVTTCLSNYVKDQYPVQINKDITELPINDFTNLPDVMFLIHHGQMSYTGYPFIPVFTGTKYKQISDQFIYLAKLNEALIKANKVMILFQLACNEKTHFEFDKYYSGILIEGSSLIDNDFKGLIYISTEGSRVMTVIKGSGYKECGGFPNLKPLLKETTIMGWVTQTPLVEGGNKVNNEGVTIEEGAHMKISIWDYESIHYQSFSSSCFKIQYDSEMMMFLKLTVIKTRSRTSSMYDEGKFNNFIDNLNPKVVNFFSTSKSIEEKKRFCQVLRKNCWDYMKPWINYQQILEDSDSIGINQNETGIMTGK